MVMLALEQQLMISASADKVSVKDLVMLASASYKRRYDELGYIYNSLTKKEQYLDEFGAFVLELIGREPISIRELLKRACSHKDFQNNEALKQILCLVSALAADNFILIGKSKTEMKNNDPKFSYGSTRSPLNKAQNVKGYLPHQKEFFFERFKDRPRILRFQMEITSKCNEKCVHCYHPADWFVHKDIDLNLGLKVLDELKQEGTLTVCFSGGEAFLHKDFDRLLYRARENDFVIIVLTNATHISDYYIDVLKDVSPEEVQVSLYSMTPEEHDSITKIPGSHARTMEGIKRLMKENIFISIGCPVMKGNKDCYKDVVKWADANGIMVKTDFMLYACTDYDQSNLSNRLSIEEVEGLIRETLQFSRSYKATVDKKEALIDPLSLIKKPPCGAGRDSLAMNANGDYYFCSVFRPSVLGNPITDSLQNVWRKSRPLLELRNVTWEDFPGCMKCEAFNFCSMCFARNSNENNGDPLKLNKHCCEISFLNKRIVEEYWKDTNNSSQPANKKRFKVAF